jgi:hypothetical protein
VRRFDFAIAIPSPTPDLIRRCAAIELAPEKTPGYDRSDLVEKIVESNPPHLSAVVAWCKWIRRDLCLARGANIDAMLAAKLQETLAHKESEVASHTKDATDVSDHQKMADRVEVEETVVCIDVSH